MKKPDFMKKRYGFDGLFFAVTGVCAFLALLAVTVLKRIPHLNAQGVLSILGLIMIINTSRVFSTQISKRKAENIRFKLWKNKLLGKKGNAKRKSITSTAGAKCKCKCDCGQTLKTPSERGRHIVVCKKCGKRNLIDL